MTTSDPGTPATTSPDKNPEAFPILTDDQLRVIAEFGERRRFDDGDDVWQIGQPMTSLFVVERGAVEVYQVTGTGDEHRVVIHEPGEFTGDIDLLSTSATVVGARARGETETLEVSAERLRRLVVENSELSDILLAAFLARRQELIATGRGSLTIIGSRFSPDTFRIREFLERNSRPFEWVDVETDARVSRLLEGEKEKLLHMEERIRRRVVGQDDAVVAVSNAVRRARAGLKDPDRPIGSFLFLGPTGVG